MKFPIKINSKEIEKKFNRIGEKIKNSLKKGEIPDENIFKELDSEFSEIKKIYEFAGDKINLLYVEHNYLLYTTFRYLPSDPTYSLRLYIESLSKLIERHRIRPYPQDSLRKMIGMYRLALKWIEERAKFIKLQEVENKFKEFVEEYVIPISINEILELSVKISFLFVKRYSEITDDLKIKSDRDFEFACELEKKIDSILNPQIDIEFVRKSYLPSMCYECLYKLRKKQLHYLVRALFFENSESKRKKIQSLIDKMTKDMLEFSKLSITFYQKYLKNHREDEKENTILAMSLKELDHLAAKYYYLTYSKKDMFQAWHTIDEIKRFIVKKVFKEKVPLSESLISYFGEEWSLIYIFAKIYLLKEEVNKRRSALTQDWERDIFTQIIKNLEELEGLFKYETKHSRDYTLKIMAAQFSGGFSEYFIHELFLEYFESGDLDDETPEEFRDLLMCVKTAKKESIVLNDHPEKNEPDIDIHIKGKCAVFLKNARIDSEVMGKIWKEIEFCNKKKIKKVFYGINFIKNLQNIEYIRKHFEKIENTYPLIEVQVFDIKDLVSVLLSELERSGKSKLNFSELDLYKVLDY
ncbi:hypothetical protein [Archaeoglobus sp.]